jgi:hypothetical protein
MQHFSLTCIENIVPKFWPKDQGLDIIVDDEGWALRDKMLLEGQNQFFQQKKWWRRINNGGSMREQGTRSILCRCWKLRLMQRQIWRTYYVIPKLFRHHLFFPMDWCDVYAAERVLGKFRIIQELEGECRHCTLHAHIVGFFIGGSLSEIALRTTPLLEPQEAYARAPLECSGKDTT